MKMRYLVLLTLLTGTVNGAFAKTGVVDTVIEFLAHVPLANPRFAILRLLGTTLQHAKCTQNAKLVSAGSLTK